MEEELVQFASYRGCTVELVYDAAGNVHAHTGGSQIDKFADNVNIVWVRDRSADSYLEELTLKFKIAKKTTQVWMCTNDRAILDMASGNGAYTMSANLLIQVKIQNTKTI